MNTPKFKGLVGDSLKNRLMVLAVFSFLILVMVGALLFKAVSPAAANCTPPSPSYGQDVLPAQTVSTATTYYVWVQMETTSSSDNQLLMSVGNSCFSVGGSSLPTNSLTWVNYQNGSTTNLMSVALPTGSTTITLYGSEPNVGVDNVLLLANPNCIPSGNGSNCASSQTLPSAPTNLSATYSGGSVTLTWSASTDVNGPGIGGYYVYKGTTASGSPAATISASSPLSYSDNSVTPGQSVSYTVQAFDSAAQYGGTTAVSPPATQSITIPKNPPSTPVVSGTAVNAVSGYLTWAPVTENGATLSGNYMVYEGTYPTGVSVGNLLSSSTLNSNNQYQYNVSGLSEKTAYNFYVIAEDSSGNSSNPGSASFTTTAYPNPNPPQNLSYSSTSTAVNLTWTAGTDPSPGPGIAGFNVYRNGSLIGGVTYNASTSTYSYNDTGLSANTSYNYCVAEYDSDTPANLSSQVCQTALTAALPISLSTPVISTTNHSVTQTSITINWSASVETGGTGSNSVAGYIVTRTGGLTGSVTKTLGNVTSYSDTGLSPNTAYEYTVQALDNASPPNYSAVSSPIGLSTTSYPAPNSPTNITSSNIQATSATISWQQATPASGGLPISGYYVIRNGATIASVPQTSQTSYSYSDTALSPNTQYTYSIEAYDSQNDVSSAITTTITTPQSQKTQPPTAPLNLVASALSSTQINLSWSASTQAPPGTISGYTIYRSTTNSTSTFKQVGTSTTTSFGDTVLTAGTTYYYYVVGNNSAGLSSAASAIAQATTSKASAANYATVQGVVTNSQTKAPIAGASVVTGGSDTSYGSETTTTNSTGNYTVINVIVSKTSSNLFVFRSSNGLSKQYLTTSQPITYTLNVQLTT